MGGERIIDGRGLLFVGEFGVGSGETIERSHCIMNIYIVSVGES